MGKSIIQSANRQLPLFDPISIPLTKGYVALVDPIDADLLYFSWYAVVDRRGHVYAVRKVSGKTRFLHLVILERILCREMHPKEQGDHIDLNTLNNIRSNLRPATPAQNTRNRRKSSRNSSGFKGVTFQRRRNRWRAQITVDGKLIEIGTYRTPEDAYNAYCRAARKLHGEFARLE